MVEKHTPPERHFLGLSLPALEAWLTGLREPTYRAKQVMEWVYHRGANDFAGMTNLSKLLRERLAGAFDLFTSHELRRSAAPDGTTKLLLQWPDEATTETVMIPATDTDDEGRDHARRTACLSTQVGCDVGCRFCASGIGGALRNLTTGEIVEQAVQVSRMLTGVGEQGLGDKEEVATNIPHSPSPTPTRLTHLVFMGMGEPLANYDATLSAIRILNADWGLGIGARKITVSTVGLPQQIERLADEGLQLTLALSLHAPNDELRQELIPWAKGIPLEKVLTACQTYFRKTGREITLEYCLLAGVNDEPEHIRQLARIALPLRAHVNVMMYNPVEGLPFQRPSRNRAVAFLKELRAAGVNAHLRHSRGLETDAACGQLRRRAEREQILA